MRWHTLINSWDHKKWNKELNNWKIKIKLIYHWYCKVKIPVTITKIGHKIRNLF